MKVNISGKVLLLQNLASACLGFKEKSHPSGNKNSHLSKHLLTNSVCKALMTSRGDSEFSERSGASTWLCLVQKSKRQLPFFHLHFQPEFLKPRLEPSLSSSLLKGEALFYHRGRAIWNYTTLSLSDNLKYNTTMTIIA